MFISRCTREQADNLWLKKSTYTSYQDQAASTAADTRSGTSNEVARTAKVSPPATPNSGSGSNYGGWSVDLDKYRVNQFGQ